MRDLYVVTSFLYDKLISHLRVSYELIRPSCSLYYKLVTYDLLVTSILYYKIVTCDL